MQKYILVFLFLGSALAINPWLTTDVFEFPKLLVLVFGVSAFSIVNLIDVFRSHGTQKSFSFPGAFLFLGIFVAGNVLAYLLSPNQEISLAGAPLRFQGFLTNIYYVLLALNVFYFFSKHPEIKTRRIFNWLLWILAAVCITALLPYIFSLSFFKVNLFSNRAFGTLGNPNYLAIFLASITPFAFFLVSPKKWYFWLLIALLLLTLFLTGSRSAWISAVGGFLLLGCIRAFIHKKYKIIVSTVAAIFILGALVIFQSRIQTQASQQLGLLERFSIQSERDTSLKTRFLLWRAGLRLFVSRPFTGYGQDNIKGHIEAYVPEYLKANDVFFIDRTHSEFIDVLVTLGIIGFAGYAGFLLWIFWGCLRFLIKNASAQREREQGEQSGSAGCEPKRAYKINSPPCFLASFASLNILILFHAVNFSTITSNVLLYSIAGYLSSVLLQEP